MNQLLSGMFGTDKAPRHEDNPQMFSFGGYGADGNPVAQAIPNQQGSLSGMLGASSIPMGRVQFNPNRSLHGVMGGQPFGSADQALKHLRLSAPAQGMSDDVFSNWISHQGYDPTGEKRKEWENAFGTGGVGGFKYQPMFREAT